MISRVLALMLAEIRISLRNRWVVVAMGLITVFSLLLALTGSSAVGSTSVDRLTVTATSLTTLAVYLVPLIALLMSYDSIAGESDRGTLALLLTYPVSRQEILIGKFAAQLIVILLALIVGFGLSVVAIWATGDLARSGLWHFARLLGSAVLLGAVFLGIGNLISIRCRQPGTAAALVIAVWILAVVMFDVALLVAVVADDGGHFTKSVFPWLLVISPTDAFRLFNITAIEADYLAGGLGSATREIGLPAFLPLISLMLWPVLVLTGAMLLFRRRES